MNQPNDHNHRRARPFDDSPRSKRWRRRFFVLLGLLILLPGVALAYLALRFLEDRPVTHDAIEEHFKYGSTGGERESGFPYWIWQAMPRVCARHLDGEGYASLGFIYEQGKDLPIGMSKRRHMGIDRVFLNCAVCHTSTVRTAAEAPATTYLAMPSHRFDLYRFEKFVFDCVADERFSGEYLVPEIDRLSGGLSLLDRYLVYPVAIALMRERTLMLRSRFSFVFDQPEWGPGRVDTFNSAKVLFNWPMDKLPKRELVGASDFPSVWQQGLKVGMQLHWDGNNTVVEERNKSAAFGTGTTPPTIDLAAIGRIEAWLRQLKPPPYPLPIDKALAERGAAIYQELCAGCHGRSGTDFTGERVGKVTPIADIGTDRGRLDSYTYDLAVNQATLYAGYPHRFAHFRKTFGYANMPLDGLWLRGPYLHNGSVPTLRHLLEPSARRPEVFYRGSDLLDPVNIGFAWASAEERGRRLFAFDTRLPGNSNKGHEGPAYGTELGDADKAALLEHLKTF
ncbi:MAG: cytochrome c [Betaproteobacteria bacterium]|nr:MAG: cytochrome c [Betaproteobacteria bacterium]